MPSPLPMQRAAPLMLLEPLLTELGSSLDAVLAGSIVSRAEIRPDGFIPYAAFLALLDRAASLTGREDIGLLLGQRQGLSALGPLGEAMRHAATLGEALSTFAALQIRNSTGGAVYLLRSELQVILGYGVYDASVSAFSRIYDMVLAVGCNLIAELTEGAAGPEEILISRSAPRDPAPYRRLAQCPIRFGQDQTGLLFTASRLAFKLPGARRDRHEDALSRLMAQGGSTKPGVSARVRHALRPRLLMGQGGLGDVAQHLGVHPRSLRRHLQAEGTRFATLTEEVRYAAARELLLQGALDIADISATLNYSSPSAFVTAFRRWSGASPALWRQRAHLHDNAANSALLDAGTDSPR